jgi:hypothetical protein
MFGSVSSAFEECRVEVTVLHLVFKDEVLTSLEMSEEWRQISKLDSLLAMLHSGLATLTNYALDVAQWKQAHARAWFAIVRAVLIWGREVIIVRCVER